MTIQCDRENERGEKNKKEGVREREKRDTPFIQ